MKKKIDLLRLPDVWTTFEGVGIPTLTSKLVVRTDEKAIYKRWDDVYEVFYVKIREAADVFGKSYPRREAYPNNEDFGELAWCYTQEKNAIRRYNMMPKRGSLSDTYQSLSDTID
jgi:hypothetical protein